MGSMIFRSDRDAAQYITKLPRAEHDAKEWQAAMEALLRVAEHDGPTQFARIGDSESWRGINDPTSENCRSYDPQWRRVERSLVGLDSEQRQQGTQWPRVCRAARH